MPVAGLSVMAVLNKLVLQAGGNAWLVGGHSGSTMTVLYLQSGGFIYVSATKKMA
jgi:hypothetical protein